MSGRIYVAYFDDELPQTISQVEPQQGSLSVVSNDKIASVANIQGCVTVTELENQVIVSNLSVPTPPIIVTFEDPEPINIVVSKAQVITVVEEDNVKLMTAAEPVSAYMAVSEVNGQIKPSNALDINDYNKYIGIVLTDLAVGQQGKVQIEGTIERTDWSWDTTREIFIGENGALVQIPPANVAYTQEIASALTSQCLKVERGLAIKS